MLLAGSTCSSPGASSWPSWPSRPGRRRGCCAPPTTRGSGSSAVAARPLPPSDRHGLAARSHLRALAPDAEVVCDGVHLPDWLRQDPGPVLDGRVPAGDVEVGGLPLVGAIVAPVANRASGRERTSWRLAWTGDASVGVSAAGAGGGDGIDGPREVATGAGRGRAVAPSGCALTPATATSIGFGSWEGIRSAAGHGGRRSPSGPVPPHPISGYRAPPAVPTTGRAHGFRGRRPKASPMGAQRSTIAGPFASWSWSWAAEDVGFDPRPSRHGTLQRPLRHPFPAPPPPARSASGSWMAPG